MIKSEQNQVYTNTMMIVKKKTQQYIELNNQRWKI